MKLNFHVHKTTLDFSIYVPCATIGYGEEGSQDWVETSRHLFWPEALDEKARILAKGIDCKIVTRWGGKVQMINEYSAASGDPLPIAIAM
jgi:hypothetical protein